MRANLARFIMAGATALPALTSGESDRLGLFVKNLVKSQAFRVLLALGALGSSAIVLEAGRRWF